MSTAPKMSEVAARAGVGLASVSRVLSGHPDVSEQMRIRVLAAVAELGYEPNILAQSLRRDETATVGFVISDIANPLLATIIQGAEAVLRQAGYSMLLTNSEGRADLAATHLRLLRQRRVDGLIIMPADEHDPQTTALLESAAAPLVVIDRELPASIAASYVLSDHVTGIVAAADHLYDLGHRRIGLIVGPPVRPSRVRAEGLRQWMNTMELAAGLTVISGPQTPEHGAKSIARLLDQNETPTAVILGSNQFLEGALHTLHQRRVQLGIDLSLVSFDDTPLSALHQPAISVVDRNATEVGGVAAQLLLKRLRHNRALETVMLPTTYLPRPSCGRAP